MPQKESTDSNEETKAAKTKKVASIKQMLQFATLSDYLYISVAVLCSMVAAIGWPWFTLVNGAIIDAFVQYERLRPVLINGTSGDEDEQQHQHFMGQIYLYSGLQLMDAVLYATAIYGVLYCFQAFALRQVGEYKQAYFRSVLRQEVAWFEKQQSGEFASKIAGNFKKIESGLNENFGLLLNNVFGGVVQLATAMANGWKLSLVILALTPVIFGCSALVTKLQTRYSQRKNEADEEASAVSEEAISAVRTVYAFGGEEKEQKRYEVTLKKVLDFGWKQSALSAVDMAVKWCTQYASLALGVWYGVKLVLYGEPGYTIGRVVVVFWCTTGFGYCVAFATPYWEAFQEARAAAAGIFEVIERKSAIDPFSSEGKKLKEGYPADIEFRDVHFSYPSRPDVPVLRGLNLSIKSGETVALVGASGCGKSTVIQLVQRFYSPDRGSVAVGGCDVGTVNVGWLRQQMGVVGQEPVLFSASLAENITLGSGQGGEVSRESVSRAAKEANAHQFIGQLSAGYGTYVGDRGAQLSGGQKQRIAIARALVGHPRILLLDEATSALDLTSEQTVQTALHRASQGRTTLIVAHRLSTIRHAHRIVVLDQGVVKEMGTHEQLMALQGAYYDLVRAQEVVDAEAGTSDSTEKAAEHCKEINQIEGHSTSISIDPSDDEVQDKSSLEDKTPKTPHLRLFKLVWSLGPISFTVAFLSAILYGLATPVYALLLGSLIGLFGQSTDVDYLWSQTMYLVAALFCLSVGMFFFNILQISLFGFISGKLTQKLRSSAFSAILSQPISWFDRPENTSGALVARLANDAADIQGLTGLRLAMIMQALSQLVAAIAIGFTVNWQLALVALLLMPLVGASAVAASGLHRGAVRADGEVAAATGRLLIEVVNALKTVVSLHKEEYFVGRLGKLLDAHQRTARAQVAKKALLIAVAQATAFFAYAVCYFAGGYFIGRRWLSSGDFFRISESMVFGALVVGRTAVFSSDYTKAKLAAFNIFKLIDSKPAQKTKGQVTKPPTGRAEGNLDFSEVHFSYPSRPETEVLSGLSFSAKKGETVALVGASGCGKSTTVQLLEQFYECSKGKILLDGTDISSLPVDWVRSQMSLVSQEPVLFSYSIAENIAYGDNSRVVGREEIVRAAEAANVHSFVDSLPLAYDTPVGGKGSQLSGGQKQRIAIARALLRDPAVLIMDEATSALDTASEKVVQQALEEAARGRTSLLIAHRLKTIQAAQRIVVLDQGRAIEEGTHQQLLQLRGHYYRLYNSALTDQ